MTAFFFGGWLEGAPHSSSSKLTDGIAVSFSFPSEFSPKHYSGVLSLLTILCN